MTTERQRIADLAKRGIYCGLPQLLTTLTRKNPYMQSASISAPNPSPDLLQRAKDALAAGDDAECVAVLEAIVAASGSSPSKGEEPLTPSALRAIKATPGASVASFRAAAARLRRRAVSR